MTRAPELLDVDTQQLEELLHRAETQSFQEEDYETIGHVLQSYVYVTGMLRDKRTAISRLRKMLFGATTEKTNAVVGDLTSGPISKVDVEQVIDDDPEGCDEPTPHKRTGHGRNAAQDYTGGERVEIRHPTLEAGDLCPDCQQGTLYDHAPGLLVRIVGQAPLYGRVYELQKFRCHLCGKLFQAPSPSEAGPQKYDATAAAMIALLKYGSGLPFNRLQGLQGNLKIPLPASTQWDVVHAFAATVTPVYEELIRQAAQGEVLHNDDTTVRILERMGQRKAKSKETSSSERSGLFTSGVMSLRGQQQVALFFSGPQHAGENLADVLSHRAAELSSPIQMCDALSRNLSGDLKTIVAHCLAHARRQFVEHYDRFPDECRQVLEAFKVVYRNDANARKRGLSPEKRLQLHRIKSGQTMNRLHNWLERQFREKKVEPNSALGGAIRYLLKHWERLTLFLRKPGAPLDNNLCERALKKSILHRKNSLFYRSTNGARVGDMYMSVIHTCELCDANPFEYLVALDEHAEAIADCPELWMPWNYQAAIEAAAFSDSEPDTAMSSPQ